MAVRTKKNSDSKFSHDVNRCIFKVEFCNSWCWIFTKRSVILNPDMKLKKEKSIHQADWVEEQGHHEETLPSALAIVEYISAIKLQIEQHKMLCKVHFCHVKCGENGVGSAFYYNSILSTIIRFISYLMLVFFYFEIMQPKL